MPSVNPKKESTPVREMLAAVFVAILPTAALAHHSAAVTYNIYQTSVIEGSVKDVAWINPHVEIEVLLEDQSRWRFETRPPGFFSRQGISKSDLEAFVGQKATVKLHPARDGSRRGWLVSATFENGAALTPPAD